MSNMIDHMLWQLHVHAGEPGTSSTTRRKQQANEEIRITH